ncbi:MAG: hypothetical protein QOD41_3610 [Cryptosporangiaceae bacterium]|jgi:GNAT superfamily N-acetyltransferase|nr:hypothetical protein [Cryptosporangiaceae bacterium]
MVLNDDGVGESPGMGRPMSDIDRRDALPPQRTATHADIPAIGVLMRESARGLFPAFYDSAQTASGVQHIAHLDTMLIDDGTYFVHEQSGELVACGGWSRRGKLYAGGAATGDEERLLDPRTEPARVRAMFVRPDWTRCGLGRALLRTCEQAAAVEGFTELALMATLPGVPLYEACGFTIVERVVITLPDKVEVDGAEMRRRIGF